MKKSVISLFLLLNTFASAEILSLEDGWNLIGANSNLSLSELKTKIGDENLLIVQGEKKTYQKSYSDDGLDFLNSFEAFETGKGYWIKVEKAVNIEYDKIIFSEEERLSLVSGWNLINPSSDLSINDIIAQLGENLEVIQGAKDVYKKSYTDANQEFLNSFKNFEEPQGYWIKVVSDTTLTFPAEPMAPSIMGTAKTQTKQYDIYHFLPEASDANGDNLTFGIQNKPSWAEFNSSTGELTGVPLELGSSENIVISVSDGSFTTALQPFSIEVTPAQNIAKSFGTATISRYYWDDADGAKTNASYPSLIDEDKNNTIYIKADDIPRSWAEVALLDKASIYRVNIYAHDYEGQLTDASVYLLDSPIKDIETLDDSRKIGTLSGEYLNTLELNGSVSGKYLAIKQSNNGWFGLSEVEIFGTLPDEPIFTQESIAVDVGSAYNIGDKVVNVQAFDFQEDALTYVIIGDVPFDIDIEGNIFVNDSLEVKNYSFEVEVSDGVNTIRTPVTLVSTTDTHTLNEAEDIFMSKAQAFTTESSLDELTQSYMDYAHLKAKDSYNNFMTTALDDATWEWIESDTYIKEGLYASRFPANPYVIKNLADFKSKLIQEDNASLFDEYKNVFLGLAVNAKERGVSQEAVFGDTREHKTIDYANLPHYEEKERVWRDELIIKDLGYGINYIDFKNYLYLKYDLSNSERDALADTTILRNMANDGVDIASADYDTRKEYGLSFDGLNLYRIVSGQSRADCQAMGNPCEQIQTWLDTNGTVTASEFLVHFSTYKSEVTGLINPLDNMNNELMEFMGVAPDKYRLMSFYDLAKWKISLDKITPIDFNDAEPNWPIFDASMQYDSTKNAYPWQMMTLEQSAQKQECGYVKGRFFETDKDALRASYPPNAVDGGAGAERRFKEYTTYTWAYNEPEVWFRASEWSPHRTVYRILQDGGVCGRQSTMGQHVNECLNRPSIGIGQPGHRAWVGVYNHATIDGQYYIKIGYQVGSKESGSAGINSIYDRYTQGIRDTGLERFGGVVAGVSPAGVGEHIFNQSMILQHIGKILEEDGSSPEELLKKAVEIAPSNVDAWYQLARYYASKDEPLKVIDLANEFMGKRDNFFLDDDAQKGGENLEIITGKVIAFIALEAPSVKDGQGVRGEEIKEKLWSYLDTYEKEYRSYRTYGYQNRYLAQLYLLGQNDEERFVSEVETLFDRFLANTTSGWYHYNYFSNVYWGDVNKTALFDTLQDKTDLADISDTQRTKIYEQILDRGQGVELADVQVQDSCIDDNLSGCQSVQQFELDATEVYLTTVSNVVGEDSEVDPVKQGVDAYSTLVIPVVDDLGAERDIKVRIAKLATGELDGKLLKVNDPTAVSTEKTQIVVWIDGADNQLEANRIYSSSSRVVLRAKKRVENNEEYMGDVIIDIQDLIQGHGVTFTGEDLLSKTYQDDDTAFYFTTLDANIGPSTGVWWTSGETTLLVPVKDDNGTVSTMKLTATNNDSYLMNSAMSAGWEYALTLRYDADDNPTLESGKHYTTVMPFTIDARMWHKESRVNDRMYVEVDMVLE